MLIITKLEEKPYRVVSINIIIFINKIKSAFAYYTLLRKIKNMQILALFIYLSLLFLFSPIQYFYKKKKNNQYYIQNIIIKKPSLIYIFTYIQIFLIISENY
jgi:hypothetical protein